MKYKCQKCGFIHEGEMPDGYYCPLCYSGLFDFKLIKEEEKVYKKVAVSTDNPGIARIEEKCINCGACQNTCFNIVNIKYIKEDEPICINCGQCILTCPTGALIPKYDYNKVLDLINDPEKITVVITSPAVRVGIGDAFEFSPGEFLEGKMIAALKALGFNYVFDTTFGADLTVMEESDELKKRLTENKNIPLFTSCCPSWVKYAKIYHPEIMPNISSCKSPIGMQSTVIKEIFAKEENINKKDIVVVALTPCTAKKMEIIDSDCDYVITTSELALALRENNIDFKSLKDEAFDQIIGSSSGTIFGATGGVMLATLRVFYHNETGKDLTEEMLLIKNKDFYREYSLKIKKDVIKCAVVYKMENLEKILAIKDEFIFIEVMNCNKGCIGGGGQILMPVVQMAEILKNREKGLTKKDKNAKIKYAYKNPEIKDLYEDYLEYPLSKKSEKLLHIKQ